VIFAPGRSRRPSEIVERELPRTSGAECPFCGGNEQHTPPPTLCLRPQSVQIESDGAAHEWLVRVVPNLFPAVSAESDSDDPHYDLLRRSHQQAPEWETAAVIGDGRLRSDSLAGRQRRVDEPDWDAVTGGAGRRPQPAGEGPVAEGLVDPPGGSLLQVGAGRVAPRSDLFPAYPLHGGHEVIVETPHHVESLTQLPPDHAAAVFHAYAERMKFWFEVPGIEYVVTFKNMGAAAGASLRHTHSQLIATSLLPPAAGETGQRLSRHFDRVGRCLMCEMLAAERENGSRIVLETDRLVAYCPFASRLPYLIRVVPKRHLDRFELETAGMLAELSELTQRLVGLMESMFVTCAYNYTIHTRPRRVACPQSYHWWIEIFPRLTKVAGFEWGSDCHINPVTPELAAEQLRAEHRQPARCRGGAPAADYSD
jgi:UDPglucose--hexose-1-phosphate uridylyltransferase